MLFTLDDVREQLPMILDRWLEINRELNHVINLYFGARDNPALYMEQQFLSMIQALEGYHRHWFTPESRRRAKRDLKDRLAELIDYSEAIMIPWIGVR